MNYISEVGHATLIEYTFYPCLFVCLIVGIISHVCVSAVIAVIVGIVSHICVSAAIAVIRLYNNTFQVELENEGVNTCVMINLTVLVYV